MQFQLPHSKIYRGGARSGYAPSIENRACRYQIDNKSLVFYFAIASAGGGWTKIELHIGNEDWPELLKQMAKAFPEQSAAFIDALIVANEQYTEVLSRARELLQTDRETAENLIHELNSIREHFLQNRHVAAPFENNRARGLEVKVDDIMRQLRLIIAGIDASEPSPLAKAESGE